MKKIISMEAVRGIPRLHIDEGRVCGECKGGKQTRMSHPMSRHLTTCKVLKQALRAWYERLTKLLTDKGYKKGALNKTLFVKNEGGKIMVAQIYVNDIVFGGMSDTMVKHFANQMQAEFEMSLMGELTYFLGLQVTQMEDSTFLSQSKYARNIVKKFGMEN